MFRKIIATLSISALSFAGLAVSASEAAQAGTSKVTEANGCPSLSGHRGALREAPENTLPAYQIAGSLSADYIEIDGRFNKSNFLFSLHDDTLDRTTNGTGKLANFWLPEIQTLSAADYTDEFGNNWKTSQYGGFNADGSPKTRVPYAYDILYVAKQNNLNLLIDLKDTPTQAQMDFFMSYVDRPEFNYRSKIIWQVGTPSLINTLKTTYGYDDMKYYYFVYRPSTENVFSGEYLKSIKADGVAVPPMNVTKQAVDYWHAYGMSVITWTSDTALGVDNPAGWNKMSGAGVDILTTNETRWYRSWCVSGMPSSISKPAYAK